jgi:hypothetical protein
MIKSTLAIAIFFMGSGMLRIRPAGPEEGTSVPSSPDPCRMEVPVENPDWLRAGTFPPSTATFGMAFL